MNNVAIIDNIVYELDRRKKSASVLEMKFNKCYIIDSKFYLCKDIYSGDIFIPAKINYKNVEYIVENIAENAFSKSPISSIVIPETVKRIEDNAFWGCNGLKKIYIPKSVIHISKGAFSNCRNLWVIRVDKNNKTYDSRNNCNAIVETASNTLIVGCRTTLIYSTISIIGYGAFEGCDALKIITIPNSVISIQNWAFADCTALTSVLIPDSVKTIGVAIFYGCKSLKSIEVDPMNLYFESKNNVIIEKKSNKIVASCKISEIPKNVVKLSRGSFSGNEIKRLVLPQGLFHIGRGAFLNSKLSNIKIIDSVKFIGRSAFSGCSFLTSVILPKYLTIINEETFADCTSLKSITIPFNVVHIEKEAFYGCSSLSSIKLSESLENIGESAFAYCSSLTDIIIPNGVKYIEKEAFYDCSSLSSIILPESLENIGESAFAYCSSLTDIIIPNSVKCIEKDAFNGCSSLINIFVSKGQKERFLQMDGFQKFKGLLIEYEDGEAPLAFMNNPTNSSIGIKKNYLFFDTECNGLPDNYNATVCDVDNWPRLIQLAWIVTDEQGNKIKRQSYIIYPHDFTIDSEVEKLTGISTLRAQQEGFGLKEVLSEFMNDLANADEIIGHNVDFDFHIVGCELYRTGGAYDELMNRQYICTMQASTDFCAIPSNSPYGGYKWPKLEELYRKLFGRMFDNAHDALADVVATKECFFALKQRGIVK